MTHDGRLELDDAGGVVERAGVSSVPVDLADPVATEALAPTALDAWAVRSAVPWLSARRRTAVTVGVALLAVALGSAWWSTRPGPPATPPALTLANAPVRGADLGGPQVGPDGRLSIAFTVRAATDLTTVGVRGLSGPGLRPLGVEAGADSVPAGQMAYVQLGAALDCTDPGIASAGPSSYGLALTTTSSDGGTSAVTQLFTSSTSDLSIAVRDACLATTPALTITSADLHTVPGSPVGGLVLDVENPTSLPLTLATERTSTADVELDLSPTVTVPAHGRATVATRLFVHDCGGPASFDPITTLPNPVLGTGVEAPVARAGVTLRVGLGTQWRLASYPLPWTVAQVRDHLAATTCAGHPRLTTALVDVSGTRAADGSWTVAGWYGVTTTGIGITLGREGFTGGPVGEGSTLAYADAHGADGPWSLSTVQLDGGAGRLPAQYRGSSCDDAHRGLPTTMPVEVATPSGRVYAFAEPLDTAALRRAVDAACVRTS